MIFGKKGSGNSTQQKLGCKSVMGGFWGPFWGPLGSQNRSGKGSPDQLFFAPLFDRFSTPQGPRAPNGAAKYPAPPRARRYVEIY